MRRTLLTGTHFRFVNIYIRCYKSKLQCSRSLSSVHFVCGPSVRWKVTTMGRASKDKRVSVLALVAAIIYHLRGCAFTRAKHLSLVRWFSSLTGHLLSQGQGRGMARSQRLQIVANRRRVPSARRYFMR